MRSVDPECCVPITRATKSWDTSQSRCASGRPISSRGSSGSKLSDVVIFFEVLLALAAVAIIAFSLYVVYRLVTDES